MNPSRFESIHGDKNSLFKPDYGYTFFVPDQEIPIQILYDLMNKVATKYYDYYYFNYTSFRKMMFMNLFDPLAETIMPAYCPKYQYMYLLKRPVTYQTVTTIIRHICNKNGVPYKSVRRLKLKSEQNRDYCIYRPPDA